MPATGACGSTVSPSSMRTRCAGTPNVCAAICVITVYAPVPKSWAAAVTRTRPSGKRRTAAEEGDWSAVDFVPAKAVAAPVTLETIKADQVLKEMALVRNSRISVTPVNEAQFNRVLVLAGTKL